MGRIRVGIIFGGRSSEHEISLRSALAVIEGLDPVRYELVALGITRAGRWYRYENPVAMLREKVAQVGQLTSAEAPVSLLPEPAGGELVALDGAAVRPAGLRGVDVVFPVLHGTYGEDGTIQGLLELADLPYVGPGVLGSALGMDKDVQKRLLRGADIPIVDYATLEALEYRRDHSRALRIGEQLGYPLFVKPNALGSSVGMTRVKAPEALSAAVQEAFAYDRKILLEAACEGRELECAVLGNEEPQASLPGEVIVSGRHDFYSYECKYLDPDGATLAIPAQLPEPTTKLIQELSVAAFRALSLRGMARVDFLASGDLSRIFVNELNTIPGFTTISMYPKLWEASGLPLPRLLDRLIELALQEHRERRALAITPEVGKRPA